MRSPIVSTTVPLSEWYCPVVLLWGGVHLSVCSRRRFGSAYLGSLVFAVLDIVRVVGE